MPLNCGAINGYSRIKSIKKKERTFSSLLGYSSYKVVLYQNVLANGCAQPLSKVPHFIFELIEQQHIALVFGHFDAML
jgi:hypothetical protein